MPALEVASQLFWTACWALESPQSLSAHEMGRPCPSFQNPYYYSKAVLAFADFVAGASEISESELFELRTQLNLAPTTAVLGIKYAIAAHLVGRFFDIDKERVRYLYTNKTKGAPAVQIITGAVKDGEETEEMQPSSVRMSRWN